MIPCQLERSGSLCHRQPSIRAGDFSLRGHKMVQASGLMTGKRGIIMGVANNRSIAWGIAKAIHAQGGEIAFTYQGEALKKRVEPLAAELGAIRSEEHTSELQSLMR